jgi:nucleotide-binding universal stress UspA family protein
MFRNILVPFDFGEASERALDLAMDLGRVHGSRLTLLHVCEVPAYAYAGTELSPIDLLAPLAEAGEERLKQRVREVKVRYPEVAGVFKIGSPSEETLATVVDAPCDLVVMGTHGRRGIPHAMLGSVAEKVVRLSKVPVLTVHAAASPAGRTNDS